MKWSDNLPLGLNRDQLKDAIKIARKIKFIGASEQELSRMRGYEALANPAQKRMIWHEQ